MNGEIPVLELVGDCSCSQLLAEPKLNAAVRSSAFQGYMDF